jgi:hypothetical protein
MWGCGILGLLVLGRISSGGYFFQSGTASAKVGIDKLVKDSKGGKGGDSKGGDSKVHMHCRSNIDSVVSIGGIDSAGSVEGIKSIEEKKKYLMAYIDKVVPAVFRSTGSCWKSMWKELSTHHR